MLPSIIMNAAIVLLIFGSCAFRAVKAPKSIGQFFRYFTTLSNMLCAFSALVMLLYAGAETPFWATVFKFTGTAAVTVTMLTVLIFLGPLSHKWKALLYGIELVMHLICPLLAIVSFVFFEKTALPAWVIAFGVAPVLLYGLLYGIMVLGVKEERRWEDFYGFNRGGKWKLSFCLMLLGAAAVSAVLWLI